MNTPWSGGPVQPGLALRDREPPEAFYPGGGVWLPSARCQPQPMISVPPIPPPVRYARRFDGQWLTATSLTGPWRQWPHPDQGLPPGTWEILPEGLSDAGALCWWASGRVGP